MSKEYYIPTIEEFHIGFECEANYNNKMMIPITMQGVGQEVVDYHKQNVYRVKYLDKEDIEILGFRRDMVRTTLVNNFIFYKDNISLSFDNQINDLKISVLTKSERTCDLFVGHIKNISELKVLLKQLNIHD